VNELTDTALLLAKEHLNNLDLEQALQAIDQSLKKRQQDSGSDLSVHGNLLWTKILLTKGRFLRNVNFPALALSKLLALKEVIPPLNKSIDFLPFYLLIGEGRFRFIGLPLKIRRGTSSPVRAIAVFED